MGTKKENALWLQAQAPPDCLLPAQVEKDASRRSGPRGKPEEALQKAVCELLDLYPKILYWHTPSQMFLGKPDGKKLGYLSKLKSMGWKRGVPDLCLMLPSKYGTRTVFLELKAGKNNLTEEQTQFMQAAQYRGATCAIIRSVEEVQQILSDCGIHK